MIVVVADTSPLNYLVQISREGILPALYTSVFVPTAVVEELKHPGAVSAVRRWLELKPSWLIVRDVVSQVDPALARLDPGEREAIQLAKQEHADLLLMDERLGVRIAREQGLAVTAPCTCRGLLRLTEFQADLGQWFERCGWALEGRPEALVAFGLDLRELGVGELMARTDVLLARA